MADETAQAAQPEAPPPWFQQFTAELGGALQHQNAQIQQIAQRVDGRVQAPAPKPIEPTTQDIRGRIHMAIANEPERYTAEIVGTATQIAEQKINERVSQAVQGLEQRRQEEQFWGQFWASHPDLTAFPAQVREEFDRTNPNLNPFQRAEMASEEVRKRFMWLQQQSQEAERQQQLARRGMAGAAGRGIGAPDMSLPDPMDAGQRTAQAIAEREEFRRTRMANQLRHDPEYFEQVRQIKLQRVRESGRAA